MDAPPSSWGWIEALDDGKKRDRLGTAIGGGGTAAAAAAAAAWPWLC